MMGEASRFFKSFFYKLHPDNLAHWPKIRVRAQNAGAGLHSECLPQQSRLAECGTFTTVPLPVTSATAVLLLLGKPAANKG